jgi:hypothetical protein
MGISAKKARDVALLIAEAIGGIEGSQFSYPEGADALREHLLQGIFEHSFGKLSSDDLSSWLATLLPCNGWDVIAYREQVVLAILSASSRHRPQSVKLVHRTRSTTRLFNAGTLVVSADEVTSEFLILSGEPSSVRQAEHLAGVIECLLRTKLITIEHFPRFDGPRFHRDGSLRRARIPGRHYHLPPITMLRLSHPVWREAEHFSSHRDFVLHILEVLDVLQMNEK